MNILILGSGGREHALAFSYSKSKKAKQVFVAPGNDFMEFSSKEIKTIPSVSNVDFDAIKRIVKKYKIDLVDVAGDDPVALGFVDKLTETGVLAFGPTQKAAQIEWSKEWARNFMVKYNLPIPSFRSFNNPREAIAYVNKLPNQLLFIKATGLALGKGVIKAENRQQAKEAILVMKSFGKAGETFLIEEGLVGEEFSLLAICDGENFITTKSAQDHKTIYNADQGPNTGGIGSVAPTNAVNKQIIKKIESAIIKPLLKGMIKENRPYKGILYLGGIITHSASSGLAKNSIKVIEFNARWGDPEAEVILPGIKTDYLQIVQAVLSKKLNKLSIAFDNKVRVSIAACARGYPKDYSSAKGKEIFGLQNIMKLKGIEVFGSGIKKIGKRFFVNGGRILHIVAKGSNIIEARRKAYEAMSLLYVEGNNLHYRTDIGYRDVERSYKDARSQS